MGDEKRYFLAIQATVKTAAERYIPHSGVNGCHWAVAVPEMNKSARPTNGLSFLKTDPVANASIVLFTSTNLVYP